MQILLNKQIGEKMLVLTESRKLANERLADRAPRICHIICEPSKTDPAWHILTTLSSNIMSLWFILNSL